MLSVVFICIVDFFKLSVIDVCAAFSVFTVLAVFIGVSCSEGVHFSKTKRNAKRYTNPRSITLSLFGLQHHTMPLKHHFIILNGSVIRKAHPSASFR